MTTSRFGPDGLADLEADRGNLPAADLQLARVIADAVSERTRDMRGLGVA